MKNINAIITGVAGYVPDYVLNNDELSRMVDTNDEWIVTRTGIKERRLLVEEGLGTSYMARKAAKLLLKKTGVDPDSIDAVIVATTTPDYPHPSTASIVLGKLELKNAFAFDFAAACCGFMYALDVASNMIQSGRHKRIIVLGADKMSAITDYEDRATCPLFGDGAGAVILEASEQEGIISTHLHASADKNAALLLPQPERGVAKSGYIEMQGNETFKLAVRELSNVVEETLAANNLDKKDIDWLVPHQANLRIISATAKKLDMDMSQVVVTLDRYANNSAATVPVALDEAVRDGRIQRGQLLLLEAFGGGWTWGSALVRF